MKNWERQINKILEVAINGNRCAVNKFGRVVPCCRKCRGCMFEHTENCKLAFADWCMEEEENTHHLKILPEYYISVIGGIKNFEIRKNDRDFKVGDTVILHEFDGEKYSGANITIKIKYVLKNCPEYGLKDGYCIFCW